MPHLLIAGATGSGKTVCINSIITSLLYFASPDDLRFIMVDPKIVEMKAFNDLPHMLIPVVTDPKKVPAALRWLIGEMEMRYQIFGKVGVRNIAGFNGRTKLAKEMPAAPSKEERKDAADELGIEVPRDDEIKIPEKMPYIVCIIDELADLMMVAPADIETGIARLAQLARAAGIHLILATQRPSVNVITGVIKANLPCRIAFQVASKVDSRTILDSGGADQLIGRGDMLFSPPGTAKLVRAQGGYVSDEELHRVVDFLKRNGPPEFAEDVQAQIEAGDVEDGDGEDEEIDEADDELMKQAMEVLRSTRRASTSMLQRRLRIGYNRAARIMELLESRGIVGPENGSSPREILVDLDTL
jgi:S-DNA-T family DNA segregation ATPase FtsK/SpoIIIE